MTELAHNNNNNNKIPLTLLSEAKALYFVDSWTSLPGEDAKTSSAHPVTPLHEVESSR